jgi:REP element-mobilizing transposase RayT
VGREPRIRTEELPYHVTSRGIRRLLVFEDALDYAKFEQLLGRVVKKHDWPVHAYCQMPNHFHLALHTPECDISEGMWWLNGMYARWFNERHGYSGHVFESRFGTELIESNAHLLNVASYVPLNPVRAGLCRRPEQWRWSSYRVATGRSTSSWLDPNWLLAQFGRDRAGAQRAYERYVLSRMAP